jgi:DNA-binding CsgD family transcriptional regulator
LSVDHLLLLLDQIDVGLIVVDGAARVLFSNEAARIECRVGGVIERHDGHLDVDGPSLVALRTAVVEAVEQHRHQLVVLRAGENTLKVGVQPLRHPGQAPLALLMLQRRQLCTTLMVEMLANQHALTLAEKRVLVHVLHGRRLETMAAEHGVELTTVRSQAAALRKKFGVRRLEDVLRLAAELPPMAPTLSGLLAPHAPGRPDRERRPPRAKKPRPATPG